MLKYKGYAGKILYINLSTEQIHTEAITEQMAEDYVGGNGFGIKILFDKVKPGADPLGPDNAFLFMIGPLQGTGLPAVSSRTAILTKSPLTGYFVDSYYGGQFGAELKYAGYDGIVITGKAKHPVYLLIKDDHVELRDATSLWGLRTFEAQVKLKQELDDDNLAIALIGPAGENLSPMACTISGVRAAGRGGTGAVLGAKNLKAVVVRGSQDVVVHDIAHARALMRRLNKMIRNHPGLGVGLPAVGTIGALNAVNSMGLLGTNNWQKEYFDQGEKLGADTAKEYILRKDACFGCSVSCGQLTKTKKQRYNGAKTIGPEYETLWSFGSNCGVNDFDAIVYCDRLCDEYGVDTISLGATISFLMECYEKKLIGRDYFCGLEDEIEPCFGNTDAMVQMVTLMVRNEGVGKKLALGTRRLAEEIGQGSERFAMHTKGMEFPAHSARGIPGMAVGYATSNRGGTHQDGRPTAERVGKIDINAIEGKGFYEVDVQRMTTMADCFVNCRMTENILGVECISQDMADILNTVTGMDKSIDDLIEIADRVYALERAFNYREGAGRGCDSLPYRFTHEPIPEGPFAGKYISEEMLSGLVDEVYEKRGYDKKTGAPSTETLKKLKLDYVIPQIQV